MTKFKLKSIFVAQPLWHQVLIVLAFNTLIAFVINSFLTSSPFINQFIISQSIGLSILLSYIILSNFIAFDKWKIAIPLFIGSILGVVVAICIDALRQQASLEQVIAAVQTNIGNIISLFFSALFFGGIIVIFFTHREKILHARTKIQAEEIRNLDNTKRIAETNLRMLQAQIEPHFLFNSLSNVISLIDSDPQKSKNLLASLTVFLRATLKRSSDAQQNLGAEINLITSYLDIMKIRMGQRLHYQINYDNDVLDCLLPPLLLQPLVENAVIHGIEPLAEGGYIVIEITRENEILRMRVSDTGKGLDTNSKHGFGLRNIRDRLAAIYGKDGHLIITDNTPQGVIATIEVPYAKI